jgi:aerobic-type carbon monoxide dehydrogenase small subunit (CoxS/CutS family)
MALKVNGIMIHRYTAKRHEPRGIFCDIGRCTDCVMVVDGQPNVRTCITPLRAGMKVETQYGAGAKPFDEAGADTSAESTGKDAREEKRS